VRSLGISEPALLLRAAGIDEAAADLVADARTRSKRRDGPGGPPAETRSAAFSRRAARLAAKDFPASQRPLDRQAVSPIEPSAAAASRHRPTPRPEDATLDRSVRSADVNASCDASSPRKMLP